MVMRTPTAKKIFGIFGIDTMISLGIMILSMLITVNSAYQQIKMTMDSHTAQLKSMSDIQAHDHDLLNTVAQKVDDLHEKHEQIAGK